MVNPPPQLQEDGVRACLLEIVLSIEGGGDIVTFSENDVARYRAALAATRTAAAPDLMAAIRDMPLDPVVLVQFQSNADRVMYALGHRHARHAAAQLVSASTAAPVARSEKQSSVHPAAPSSPSALRAVPLSEPCASEPCARPVRLSHTPGPWTLVKHNSEISEVMDAGDDWTIKGADGQRVCFEGTAREAEANAHLIKAAPDLLAALIEMEREKSDYMRRNNLGDPSKEHTNKMARAAIALATGAQHDQ